MSPGAARLLPAFLVALLGACATLPEPAPQASGAERTLTGRLSVRYQAAREARDETVFASFEWSENAGAVHLKLLDPLGQSLAVIDAAPGAATLTLRNGQHFAGATPEELTAAALGWRLPLAGLGAWLDGRAVHGAPITVDADGVRHLDEDGWHIQFSGATGGTDMRPRHIDLSYGGPGPTIDMRIVVDGRSGA